MSGYEVKAEHEAKPSAIDNDNNEGQGISDEKFNEETLYEMNRQRVNIKTKQKALDFKMAEEARKADTKRRR